MVAPSFQSMTVVSEVYTKDGKQYIDVRNEKTGTVRHVRWYTDAEYAKAYGNKSKDKGEVHLTPEQRKFYASAAVRSMVVTNHDPLTLKARVAADTPAEARVLLWQTYGAKMQEEKKKEDMP